MVDYTTMIGLRDYITRDRQIRLPVSDLGPYHALVARAFHAFQRDPNRYTLHLHFFQNTSCRDDDILDPAVWDQGRYFVGGRIEFFAHFVDMGLQRAPGGGISASPRSRAGTMGPPAVPSRGMFTLSYMLLSFHQYVILAPTPTFSELPPIPAPVNPYLKASPDLGRSPSERRPDRQAPRTRRDGNSTTVYALAPPMPSSHYPNARYFSAPWAFIPVPPGPTRPRTHAQQYAEPFPGFRPVGGTSLGLSEPSELAPGLSHGSRSPSTEYDFDEGAENSPVREEEQVEEGLFVPEDDGVDMATALAWDEDEDGDWW
jgi:hypothetical protein